MVNLYYIGADEDFKRNSAGTARIINNCKAINQKAGYNIKIIGYSEIERFKKGNFEVLNTKRGKNTIQKFYYYLMRSFSIIRLLKLSLEKPDIIIYYGTSTRILFPLLQYCKHHQIKLIVDVVEWYDYSHLPYGKYGPIALDVHIAMTKLIPKCDGVIAISSFLKNYYIHKGIKTIRIPILIDSKIQEVSKSEIQPFNTECLNLIYAGFPGKKDLIMHVIEAVEYLNTIGFAVQLHILGPTKSELELQFKYQFTDSIVFHGRVPQSLVSEYLKNADFSVLIRPDERYAHAGFPTKFVESLNASLPVVANLTSDLSLYLKDGYNGFVVMDYSVDALIEVLMKINTLDENQRKLMKMNARNIAVNSFDYRHYSEEISLFIQNTMLGSR